MTVVLIYPPTCDPTAPYISLPALAGSLRAQGLEVALFDANVEAYDRLLRSAPLGTMRDRIEERIAALERRPVLRHHERLLHATLWQARADAHAVPRGIEEAVATLRDEQRFFDAEGYARAVDTVDAALRVVSAAHAPLALDFTGYRTPFALTSAAEISHDADPSRDPFAAYLDGDLIPRIRALRPRLIGISVCFPGQLQPAYSFALKLRRAFPDVHLTVGGPAISQVFFRLSGEALKVALGAFDSAVVGEGEKPLLALYESIAAGNGDAVSRPEFDGIHGLVSRDGHGEVRIVPPAAPADMTAMTAPDFTGLPLERYFAPKLVLPYDLSRGCYWGRCAFCHYGLTESGTTRYRERAVATAIEQLAGLAQRFGTRNFYLSQDAVAPAFLVRLAEGLVAAGLDLRWATDVRPERYFTVERARTLRRGGAVAFSLGVESAAPRVLQRMDKGLQPDSTAQVIENLAAAGIAVEVMAFTGFPGETRAEALETVRFIRSLRKSIAAFIIGRFALVHGARVARDPAHFGLRETWSVQGDVLETALFFRERGRGRTPADDEAIDDAVASLSEGWALRGYPWCGSLSTAHTVLTYERLGPGALRERAGKTRGGVIGRQPCTFSGQFSFEESEAAFEHEAAIWFELTQVMRRVSRSTYDELAARGEAQRPNPCRWSLGPEGELVPARTRRTRRS